MSKPTSAQVKRLNQAVFDGLAPIYDSQSWGRLTLPLLAEVRKAVHLPPGGALLDVGCGTGAFLAALAEGGGAELAGVDLSPEMIQVAAGRLGSRADLRVGDAEHLPWPAGRFDAVTCSSSFHHYPGPEQALAEIRRVLRLGGQLVLADFWLPAPVRQLANWLILPRTQEGDVRVYSRREVTRMLASAGFGQITWTRHGLWNYVAVATAQLL